MKLITFFIALLIYIMLSLNLKILDFPFIWLSILTLASFSPVIFSKTKYKSISYGISYASILYFIGLMILLVMLAG